MMKILVTGASRGIGLEFVRQLLERGDAVAAVAREPNESSGLKELSRAHPQTLQLHRCDVTSDEGVASLARQVGSPLDWLINNAGVGGDEASFVDMDLDSARKVLEVNALSPLRVTRALLPALRAGAQKKVVHLTSKMGSLADNRSGGWVAYRMSKAALNMASLCMALELRSERILSVVLHPGWVQTDMGGAGAPISPAESVKGMLKVIEELSPEQSGRFFDFRGAEVPW